MFFNLVFYGLPKSEKSLRACVEANQDSLVCTRKIIGSRIVYVCIKIRENAGYIMAVRSAVNRQNRRVVISRIRNSRRLIVLEITSVLICRMTFVPRSAVRCIQNFECLSFF